MRAVFLDRDGVINIYRDEYVRTLADFEYYPETAAAFAVLGALGMPIVVVTNQSALARGYTTLADVEAIHARLRADAASWGARIAAIEFCPHLPDDHCRCRKPRTLMFERAAARLALSLPGSYMVGDAPSDMEAGRALNMITLRVASGRGSGPVSAHEDMREPTLLAAARRIAQLEHAN
ncbi:MAG: D-glycero-alpha-D-manno-heptose-1,7-bisphosphate 7-phosphatase [Planctomycetota bacterium]